MQATIAGLKKVREWFAAADARFHEATGQVDAFLHAKLAQLDALIAKLEGTFAASGELSAADESEVEAACAAFQGD